MIDGRFYDDPDLASEDEMRTEAQENLDTIKSDDSYMAPDVLVLSRWILRLLERRT